MKLKIKAVLLAVFILTALACISSCSAEVDQYAKNDTDNYNVSVKYDANGGFFTTNTSVIVDSYNISEMEEVDGNAEIALLSPDNPVRGKNDTYSATKEGYFLAGWYTKCEKTNETDKNGNPVYSYEGKWDFEEDVLKVATDGEYSSKEPVITLYAAWLPMFEIEFVSIDSGEVLETMVYNPMDKAELLVPRWSEESGTVEMKDFPERKGYTFQRAYYDKEALLPIETESLVHTATIDYETAQAENTDMKVYVEWLEGEHYRIYTAEQLADNASVSGIYEIMNDLDFTEETWPTLFMQGNFAGKIIGNGHTLSNIDIVVNNNSKITFGLFGRISEEAEITDVTFENVTLTIQKGAMKVGTSYGLFAGTLSEGAKIENVTVGGEILVDSKCYFATEDFSMGLVCGLGDYTLVENAGIECKATGDNPERVNISVDENAVTLEITLE